MQALYTMHELLVALQDSPVAKQIVIYSDPEISESPEDHVIKIKTNLDDSHLQIIKPILEKRSLKIIKKKNALIIH
jgi:hypothetical protein